MIYGNALLHFLKVLLKLDEPHTQTTINEIETIKEYCKDKKLAVEIGIYEGVNTINIARHISEDGLLYAIDPFFKGRLGICYSKLIVKNSLKRKKITHKVMLLEDLSFNVVTSVPDNIDFIFIDGDHSEEGIRKDWEDWSKKLKKNGIIALHDTEIPTHNPSVAQLGSYKFFCSVIRNDPGFEVVKTVDSLNVLKKL
jgi:predicted O-methyltransferase YrrM